ncbi:Lysine histidine transporter-like 8 [Datura stramonium]|uniref:Lysine histidine transporter-like 8 n=1 Tax=Datura stramonium TaxID=4076 RepID=A0ABS8VH09_DATST|nr:Lysine histidine transporter-like 8 [Datura stramonium]
MEERPETELISIPATPRASTPEILTPSGQGREGDIHPTGASKDAKEVGHLTKLNPQDAWLPITESRNGNAHYAAFHNLNAGIGFQALVLPVAFSFLGWY